MFELIAEDDSSERKCGNLYDSGPLPRRSGNNCSNHFIIPCFTLSYCFMQQLLTDYLRTFTF